MGMQAEWLSGLIERAARVRAALEDEFARATVRPALVPPEAWLHDNQTVTGTVFGATGPLLKERSLALADWPASVRSQFGGHVASSLVETFDPARVGLVLTDDITRLYAREFGRILDHAEGRTTYWADPQQDGPRKDLALLAGRLIPIGGGVAAPRSGLGRSTIWKGDLRQSIQFARLLWHSGGATQWLEIHTHTDSVSEFNPAGWARTYRRLAGLLRSNQSIRGVFRNSWFLDPALQAISPNLSYLASLPLSGDAKLFFVGFDRSGTCGALQRSDRRREAFESGRYVPAVYLMAWPRQALLKWHDRGPDEPAPDPP
jgi:hypothetical protein